MSPGTSVAPTRAKSAGSAPGKGPRNRGRTERRHSSNFSTSRPLSPDLDAAIEARAVELDGLGLRRLASRLRFCGRRIAGATINCRVRCCPRCAAQLAEKNAQRDAAVINRMINPTFVLFRVPSLHRSDLAEALSLLRSSVTKLQRRQCFSCVRVAVGALHAKLFPDRPIWNAHVHLVVDLPVEVNPTAWEAEMNDVFGSMTQGRGRFSIDPHEPTVEKGTGLRISRYMSKAVTYAPPPGDLDLEALDILIAALHGRQLSIRWGVTGRGRRRAARTV